MTADNSSSNFSSNFSNSSSSYIAAFVITCTSVIVLLGVPANVAVIVKLSRHLRGSSMTQRLFFNLAVCDLLCLLCLPAVSAVFYIGCDLPHEGICELVWFLFRFFVTCDRNILALMSIQRYYQVLHPRKWDKVGQKWQQLLLFSVWMLGALIALPVVFLTEDEGGKTGGHSCRVPPALDVVYALFLAFSTLVLLFFCLLLVRGVRQHQMPNRKHRRVTKLLIRIIAVSLFVGFVPHTRYVLYTVARCSGLEKLLHTMKSLRLMDFLYYSNHSLNPFLYFFGARHSRTDSNQRGCRSMSHTGNS